MPRKDTTAQLLHTINHELKMKLEEVSRADNDLGTSCRRPLERDAARVLR